MTCKIIIMIRRKDGMSEEDFHAYWSKEHPRVFLKLPIVQRKVLNYTQYHADKSDLAKLSSIPMVPRCEKWDGIVQITVAKFEDLNEIFEDEEYVTAVAEDEARFLSRVDAQLMIGYDEPKKIDGKVLSGVL